MSTIVLFFYLLFWLAVFWCGAVAFEIAGIGRSKARFQALSALSGTGFTTQESELVVIQPECRRIAIWLIALGKLGIVGLVILAAIYARLGFSSPGWHIITIAALTLILAVSFKMGLVEKITAKAVNVFSEREESPYSLAGGILHEKSEYGVARVWLSSRAKAINMTLRDTGFDIYGITVLAIERRDRVIKFPDSSEFLQPGDYILCYGNISEITRAAGKKEY